MMWSSSLFVSMIYKHSSMHYLIILILVWTPEYQVLFITSSMHYLIIILFIPWNLNTSLTEFLDHPYLHILNESDFIVSAKLTNPSPQQISLDRILLARHTAYTLILIWYRLSWFQYQGISIGTTLFPDWQITYYFNNIIDHQWRIFTLYPRDSPLVKFIYSEVSLHWKQNNCLLYIGFQDLSGKSQNMYLDLYMLSTK